MAAPLEDCCGLGCNNCILDRFLDVKRPGDTAGTINLFNKKEYQKFIVKEIKKVLPLVYQFTFELLCERDVPFRIEEQLFAPPVSYLMLRAFRNFEDSNPEFNELFMDFKEFMHPPKSEDTTKYFRMEPQRFDKGTPEIYFSRKYTPYEVNEQYRTFKILVKLETFGKMSRYFTTLKVGSICEFKGPFEAYKYKKEERENYLVFTQGISIVSAFRLVKEIIYESAQSRIILVSCFKNMDEAFLREDFFMLTPYWCLKHHIFLSSNVMPKIPYRPDEKIHQERLRYDNFRRILAPMKYFEPTVTQVLVSGRESFMEEVSQIAKQSRFKDIAKI